MSPDTARTTGSLRMTEAARCGGLHLDSPTPLILHCHSSYIRLTRRCITDKDSQPGGPAPLEGRWSQPPLPASVRSRYAGSARPQIGVPLHVHIRVRRRDRRRPGVVSPQLQGLALKQDPVEFRLDQPAFVEGDRLAHCGRDVEETDPTDFSVCNLLLLQVPFIPGGLVLDPLFDFSVAVIAVGQSHQDWSDIVASGETAERIARDH